MPVAGTISFAGMEFPLSLVGRTGASAENFEAFARQHLVELERWAPILPLHHVLELGSGIGREAAVLSRILDRRGTYDGIEIDLRSVEWCRKNISARFTNFRFHHANVRSSQYNPKAFRRARRYTFPVADAAIDRVFAHSVFTHLLPAAAARYLAETRRALAEGGLALFSCFTGSEAEIVSSRNSPIPFFRIATPHADGCFVMDPETPEASVAFSREYLLELVARAGLALAHPIVPGCWIVDRGADPSQAQDLLVLRRA